MLKKMLSSFLGEYQDLKRMIFACFHRLRQKWMCGAHLKEPGKNWENTLFVTQHLLRYGSNFIPTLSLLNLWPTCAWRVNRIRLSSCDPQTFPNGRSRSVSLLNKNIWHVLKWRETFATTFVRSHRATLRDLKKELSWMKKIRRVQSIQLFIIHLTLRSKFIFRVTPCSQDRFISKRRANVESLASCAKQSRGK